MVLKFLYTRRELEWWPTPEIPATWEAKPGGQQVQGQPDQHSETDKQKEN